MIDQVILPAEGSWLPLPSLANKRLVSAAAERSDTPSPAYRSTGRSLSGSAAYGWISMDLSCPKWLEGGGRKQFNGTENVYPYGWLLHAYLSS